MPPDICKGCKKEILTYVTKVTDKKEHEFLIWMGYKVGDIICPNCIVKAFDDDIIISKIKKKIKRKRKLNK
ncbi:MAG: hypothetical protein JSV67_05055 [Thermoplasmatales archaeon]|nr:MAG: hypothetical protein JSV67_05055 [Thermoplasmatales archaeon]